MSNERSHTSRFTRYSLLVILVAFVALSIVYSLTVPLFEGPDEIWHYAFANYLANGGGLPVFDVNQPATFLRNGAHPPLYYVLIAVLIAPIDRADFPAEYHFNLASPKVTPGASGPSPNLLIHTAREDFPFRDTALAGHLARLVSIALSALTVVGVFFVARRLLRDDRLALLATALVAFIPQFVYGAALVNNDALAACAATWLLYALLRLMNGSRWRWALLSGVLLGITLLSKIGMIAVLPIPALALLLIWWRSRITPHALRSALFLGFGVYAVAALIAGWWYARNLALYGDPLMWREWQVLTGTGRVPPTLIDFLHDMLGFFGLFWADFSLRVDRVLWPIFGLLVMMAALGLIRRAIRRQWPPLEWAGLPVAVAWLGLLLATAVRYSFNIYDIHGRLLYPALAGIGVLLALGLSGWPKPRWVMGGALAIMMSITVIAPLAIIQPAYARPIVAALPPDVTKMPARFDDIELLGYRVNPDQVKTGETLEIDTYWRRIAPADSTHQTGLRAIVTLPMIESSTLLGRSEEQLGTDAYPSWAWPINEIVRTPVLLKVNTTASAVGKLDLGVRGETAQLISSEAGDTIGLGNVIVRAPPLPCEQSIKPEITFGGAIKLAGYRVEQTAVVLCWESLKPTAVNYTVFVHAVDAKGGAVAADAPPRSGTYPTSAWQTGEQIEDTHPLPVDSMVKQVSVGLYRLDTGERLTIDNTGETEYQLTLAEVKSEP